MALFLHILIALASIIYTAYVFVVPARQKFGVIYGLFGATLLSGIYLVLTQPVHLTQTCLTGLAYFVAITFGVVAARKKLATVENRI